jgi:hypothetical protein
MDLQRVVLLGDDDAGCFSFHLSRLRGSIGRLWAAVS